MTNDISIPPELAPLLADREPIEEAIGCSESRVFRLAAKDGESLFAKVAGAGDAGVLDDEARRLGWLRSVGVAVPDVIAICAWQDHAWLVTTCVAGVDAAQSEEPITTKVAVMAEALLALHDLDASTCPFDETLPFKIERAEENVRQGKVREDLFGEAHWGIDPAELVKRLRTLRPAEEDIVIAHGDACLPNILLRAGRFSGFVDCGSAGRADRYRDLALASRSITSAFGPAWAETFFEAYGLDRIDQTRIDYYRLLDEFF